MIIIKREEILSNELSNNSDLESFLIKLINSAEFEDKTIVALRYTRIYLKEKNINGMTYVEPMTIKEYSISNLQPMASRPATKGNLTLSTVVAIDNFDRTIATAYSYADWKYTVSGGYENNPGSSYDDFMTCTHPSNYYLNTGSGRITLMSDSKRESVTSGTKEWTSKYVHNWTSAKPTISLGVTGVTIGITTTNSSWQIASYATY